MQLTATTGDPMSSSHPASTLPKTTLGALCWDSNYWKHFHCFAAAVLPLPTRMTAFCWVMDSLTLPVRLCPSHMDKNFVRDLLASVAAGAMGS